MSLIEIELLLLLRVASGGVACLLLLHHWVLLAKYLVNLSGGVEDAAVV